MTLNKKIHDIRLGNPKKNSKFLVRDRQTDEILGGTDDDGKVYGNELFVRDSDNPTKFINVKKLITKGANPDLIRQIVQEEIPKADIKPEQLVTGKLKEDVNITLVNGEKHQLVVDSGKGLYEVSDVEDDKEPDKEPDKKPDEDEDEG